jgi:LuxR family maltose regulon positive regulatory protein
LLADVLQVAIEQGRKGVQLEALAVRAMVQRRTGLEAAAMLSLEEALGIGEREGYIRVFVDLGIPMAKLLHVARARHLRPDYVGRLLSAFGDLAPAGSGEALLPEPLTPREVEVLRHLAAGLTNEEIADTLFISSETVKKHASSIFGKLGVGNRTEAAARARELDLLDGR